MCPYQNAAAASPHVVDPKLGFCPKSPLPTHFSPNLNAIHCGEWLKVAHTIHDRLVRRTLRSTVEALPLITLPEHPDAMTFNDRRLAYVCLTFLEHAYIWGDHINGEEPAQALPVQIAAPLRQVCKMLGTQPCLTYTSTLWNWTGPSKEQRRTMFSFTGLADESHFYLTLLDVEEAGGKALQLGTQAEQLARRGDSQGVAKNLMEMATALEECKAALDQVRAGCSPSAFFVNMRPYLSGFSVSPISLLYTPQAY